MARLATLPWSSPALQCRGMRIVSSIPKPEPALLASVPEPVRVYADTLAPEERLLLLLKQELYDGSWEVMQKDLQDRLEARPYVFKLISRITDDLQRIQRLRSFEADYNVDLAAITDYSSLLTPADTDHPPLPTQTNRA